MEANIASAVQNSSEGRIPEPCWLKPALVLVWFCELFRFPSETYGATVQAPENDTHHHIETFEGLFLLSA